MNVLLIFSILLLLIIIVCLIVFFYFFKKNNCYSTSSTSSSASLSNLNKPIYIEPNSQHSPLLSASIPQDQQSLLNQAEYFSSHSQHIKANGLISFHKNHLFSDQIHKLQTHNVFCLTKKGSYLVQFKTFSMNPTPSIYVLTGNSPTNLSIKHDSSTSYAPANGGPIRGSCVIYTTQKNTYLALSTSASLEIPSEKISSILICYLK